MVTFKIKNMPPIAPEDNENITLIGIKLRNRQYDNLLKSQNFDAANIKWFTVSGSAHDKYSCRLSLEM